MKMQGVLLPGQRRVEFKEFDVPEPGHGQVLVKMKASSICGQRHSRHLSRAPGPRPGRLPGRDRRA